MEKADKKVAPAEEVGKGFAALVFYPALAVEGGIKAHTNDKRCFAQERWL